MLLHCCICAVVLAKLYCGEQAFSPDGKLLLCWNSLGASTEGELTVVDMDPDSKIAGKTVSWSTLLSAVIRTVDPTEALHCPVARWGVGWMPDSTSTLYMSVGRRMVTIDVNKLAKVAEDGCFSTKQLCSVTHHRPDLIDIILGLNPYVTNLRDPDTGDTVLHHCAGTLEVQHQLHQWLPANDDGRRLGTSAADSYLPVANFDREYESEAMESEGIGRFGKTALHVAISNHSWEAASVLCEAMSLSLSPQHAVLLNDVLSLMALTLPERVSDMLEILEPKLLQKQDLNVDQLARDDILETGKTVRIDLHRDEVRGSNVFMATINVASDKLANRQHVWRLFKSEHAEAEPTPVNVFVVALAGFLGSTQEEDPGSQLSVRAPCTNNRAYQLIVDNCDSEVYTCRLMQLATQFKWENSVRPLQLKMMRIYVVGTLIATATMLVCTRPNLHVSREESIPAWMYGLCGTMVVVELLIFISEMRELVLEGPRAYFASVHTPAGFVHVCITVSELTVAMHCRRGTCSIYFRALGCKQRSFAILWLTPVQHIGTKTAR